MSQAPDTLYYTASHQWLRLEEDGSGTVGITDFAQEELGDVVFIDLPEVGKVVSAGSEVSVVESVKTASDVFSPVSGEIVAVNQTLDTSPETVNESPYEQGWIYRIQLADAAEVDALLSAQAYQQEL